MSDIQILEEVMRIDSSLNIINNCLDNSFMYRLGDEVERICRKYNIIDIISLNGEEAEFYNSKKMEFYNSKKIELLINQLKREEKLKNILS